MASREIAKYFEALRREGWLGFVLLLVAALYAAASMKGFLSIGFSLLTVASLAKRRDRILNVTVFLTGALLLFGGGTIRAPFVAATWLELAVTVGLSIIAASIAIVRLRRLARAATP